ncbi:hypothetical protein ABPG72_003547 [Tetrahymena utriculariae]
MQNEQNQLKQLKRFWMLPFVSTETFGAYFNVNFQSFVKEQLMTQMHMETSDYSWFLLLPTLPNVILPLIEGPFMDLVGVRNCLVLFTFVITIGMALCRISTIVSSLGWLVLGKTLLAISVECQNISFASSVSGIVYPQIYSQHNNLLSPFYRVISFCIMNCITSWVVFYYDRSADQQNQSTMYWFSNFFFSGFAFNIYITSSIFRRKSTIFLCFFSYFWNIFEFMCAYLFPTIPFLSQKKTLVTGFAICYSCKNEGLALMNYICGKIMGYKSSGYNSFLLFFVTNFLISMIISSLIYIIDCKQGSHLNSSTPQNYCKETNESEEQNTTVNETNKI